MNNLFIYSVLFVNLLFCGLLLKGFDVVVVVVFFSFDVCSDPIIFYTDEGLVEWQ